MNDEDNTNIPEFAAGSKRGRARRAYILLCWREGTSPLGEPAWRFVLKGILQPRRKRGFNSLEALFEYLQGVLRTDDTNE